MIQRTTPKRHPRLGTSLWMSVTYPRPAPWPLRYDDVPHGVRDMGCETAEGANDNAGAARCPRGTSTASWVR
jgi:hypothetical protein